MRRGDEERREDRRGEKGRGEERRGEEKWGEEMRGEEELRIGGKKRTRRIGGEERRG